MKRKPVKTPHESINKVVGRVVATAIRDGYGLDWATRYAGIGLTDHRALWARSEVYRGMFGTLDPDALPIDARPKPLPERVPFVGKRPAMTEAAPARSHRTWWMPDGFDPSPRFSVVEEGE